MKVGGGGGKIILCRWGTEVRSAVLTKQTMEEIPGNWWIVEGDKTYIRVMVE